MSDNATTEFMAYAARRYMEYIDERRKKKDYMREEVDRLRDDLTGLKGVTYSDMPGNPNAYGDAIPDGLARLHDAIATYASELDAWVDESIEAHNAIWSIKDGRYATLLDGRYVLGKSWEQIAVDMNYSYEYVRKELHEQALVCLYSVMPEEWRRDFPNAT